MDATGFGERAERRFEEDVGVSPAAVLGADRERRDVQLVGQVPNPYLSEDLTFLLEEEVEGAWALDLLAPDRLAPGPGEAQGIHLYGGGQIRSFHRAQERPRLAHGRLQGLRSRLTSASGSRTYMGTRSSASTGAR